MSFDLAVTLLAYLFSSFVFGVLLGAIFSESFRKKLTTLVPEHIRKALSLSKESLNPILCPGKHPWQAEAVFNPAALVVDDRTHLLYRAIGMDGVSRLGYASSANGVVFDEQLPYPAYISQKPRLKGARGQPVYSHAFYPSGGSWGGCEDPRMVLIDGRVYVSYHVFDGWDYIRVAIMSIPVADFIAKRFAQWSTPTIISPPNQLHKNWVLFPEKINGKFAILHSLSPKIEIAYRNSIEAIGSTEPFIESWVGSRRNGPRREGVWDNIVLGSGPPPLRTALGWLVFYHALQDAESHKYKVGAMLLDLQDPTKILARSKVPVIEPNEHYENDGKPGIVYACGATIQNGTVYVYYGGADKVICVASSPLASFLEALLHDERVILKSAALQTE